MTLQPAWLKEPPEKWPDSARGFYRLCFEILRREQLRQLALKKGEVAEPDPTEQTLPKKRC